MGYYIRRYDSSYSIPDEEAELRWEQQEELSTWKCLREEEMIIASNYKNYETRWFYRTLR